MSRDIGVLNLAGLVHRLADNHFRRIGGAGDGGTAAEGFELGILNDAILYFHLELDNISARGFANQRRAHIAVLLVKATNVSGIVEVIVDHLMVASSDDQGCPSHGQSHGLT